MIMKNPLLTTDSGMTFLMNQYIIYFRNTEWGPDQKRDPFSTKLLKFMPVFQPFCIEKVTKIGADGAVLENFGYF